MSTLPDAPEAVDRARFIEWSYVFEFPHRLENPLNMRGSQLNRFVTTKRRKDDQTALLNAWVAAQRPRPPALPVVITFIRIAPRAFDDGDNIGAAFKSMRDKLVRLIGLKGDSRRDPAVWKYDQFRRGVREYAVRVEMTCQVLRRAEAPVVKETVPRAEVADQIAGDDDGKRAKTCFRCGDLGIFGQVRTYLVDHVPRNICVLCMAGKGTHVEVTKP